MGNRIRECTSIAAYAPIKYTEADWETRMLRDALLTYDFGDLSHRLVESVGRTGSLPAAVMLVGPPGSGKTHLLKLLQALLGRSTHPLTNVHQRLREIHATLEKRQFFMLEAVPANHSPTSQSLTAIQNLSSWIQQTHSGENDLPEVDSDVAAVRDFVDVLAADTRLVVLIDHLEIWLKQRDTRLADRVIHIIKVLSRASQTLPLSLVIAVNDYVLDSVNQNWLTGRQVADIMANCHLEYLSSTAIPALIGVHLLNKNARQRTTISRVRDKLLRIHPEMMLDEQETINLYPLHPITWKIGARLRPHLGDFSFPEFAVKACERIKNRPAESLFTVDEMFDVLEPSLRSNPQLAYALQAYDRTIESVLPRVSQGQRLHTRMFIKAILMHTLANVPATVRDLTHSILFYDLSERNPSYALASAMLKQIKSLSRVVEAEGDDLARRYRFPIRQGQSLLDRIEIHEKHIPDTDQRIGITLASMGTAFFEDWPIELGDARSWSSRFDHLWTVSLPDASGFFIGLTAVEPGLDQTPVAFRFSFPQQSPEASDAFVTWTPQPLDADALWVLKQLVILADLRETEPDAAALKSHAAILIERARSIFHQAYLQGGTFHFKGGETAKVPQPPGEPHWSLHQWIAPLISPITPEATIADHGTPSAETLEWIGHLVATDSALALEARPSTLEEALDGLSTFFRDWQRKDVSPLLKQLMESPSEATEVHAALAAEHKMRMTAFHAKHALLHHNLNEEMEEVMYLFDSDTANLWLARDAFDELLAFVETFLDLDPKVRYVRDSRVTGDLALEKRKYEFLSRFSAPWQYFAHSAQHELVEAFERFQAEYIAFYGAAHDASCASTVIQPLCQELVTSEDWSNLELISQLSIGRHDFLVDAIDQVSGLYQMECSEPVAERLKTHPVCVCGFTPDQTTRLTTAVDRTRRYVRQGIDVHRDILRGHRQEIRDHLKQRKDRNPDVIRAIAAILDSGPMPQLNDAVVRTLNEIVEALAVQV